MTTSVTRDSFITKYRQFAAADEGVVTAAITMADLFIGNAQTKWANKYDAAIELLTAHILQKERQARQGAAGALVGKSKSRSEESISLSFASGPTSTQDIEASLNDTSYGQMFKMLRQSVASFIPFLGI
jgi:hypothetical protein